MFLAALVVAVVSIALANNTAQAPTFKQDWSNTGLITANNNWGSVPGIIGYNGTGLALSAGTDPQTILLDGSLTPVTVLANQTNTGLNTGGVAEFQLANPTIALQGDNTASAPHIVLNLDTTGRSNIHVGYNLRDIDGSTDNAAQQVALQYRVGSVGNYTNIPAGYVADATTGPSQATQVTPVSVTLPAAADNQSLVQLRIITSRATTNQKDEWVGVDDIAVTSTPTASSQSVATNAAKTITLSGTDADGDNLTFAVASAPTNGTLGAIGTPTCTGTAPKTCQANVTYTPNAGFNGSDSFQFRVNDGTVNSANATVSITVDTVAPSAPLITSPANNSYDNDGAFTVSGTAEANSSVEIFEGVQSKGTTTADGSGSWSINLSGVSEGDHTYTARATDAAGNTSPSSTTAVTVKVDTTAPNAPVIASPANNTITNDATPTFSGTAEGSSTVEIFDGGSSLGTTTADGSGDWSFTPSASLSGAVHSITAKTADAAGNISSASTAINLTVDTAASGAPSITNPANDAITNDNTPTFGGTAEANSTVELFDGSTSLGTTTADGSGDWSFTPGASLNEGTHSITATAEDAAGNTSTASTALSMTIDTVAPSAPQITAPANAAVTNDATPTFSGTAEANSTVEIFDGST
ncbi:MAG TPA: Ig-like domain-containing protein, partial [Pseudonocardiaceae bacterium]